MKYIYPPTRLRIVPGPVIRSHTGFTPKTPKQCWALVALELSKGPATKEELTLRRGLDRVTVVAGLKYASELSYEESGLIVSFTGKYGGTLCFRLASMEELEEEKKLV